jgi:membrane-associated phospholipid phosphatase
MKSARIVPPEATTVPPATAAAPGAPDAGVQAALAGAAPGWHERLLLPVTEFDRTAFNWTARRRSRVLDASMPRLTHLCDNGVLWAWLSVLLMLFGGPRGRRAARAGMLSLAIASPLVNGPAKWLVRRERPEIGVVPEQRRIRTTPRTTSFPSGHSASAWCYAIAAGMQAPALAVGLLPLAFAVSYSRVYTGAHYPTDVLAGALAGGVLGAALGQPLAALGARISLR